MQFVESNIETVLFNLRLEKTLNQNKEYTQRKY